MQPADGMISGINNRCQGEMILRITLLFFLQLFVSVKMDLFSNSVLMSLLSLPNLSLKVDSQIASLSMSILRIPCIHNNCQLSNVPIHQDAIEGLENNANVNSNHSIASFVI